MADTSALRRTVRASLAVTGNGVRLWWRHWPVLLVIALFGAAGREAAIWAAIESSRFGGAVGNLVLVFAPLSAVVSIIWMLYALRGSLPTVGRLNERVGPDDPLTNSERGLPDIMASVCVPFLFLYSMYGYMRVDVERFTNAAFFDELFRNLDGDDFDAERTVLATGRVLVVVILVALILRYILGNLQGKIGWRGFGYLGAYVEVVWLAMLGSSYYVLRDHIGAWSTSRHGTDVAFGWWHALVDALGPLGTGADAAVSWIVGLTGSLEPVIAFPGAWLLAGAVVYGHKLTPPAQAELTPGILQRRFPRLVTLFGGDLFHHIRYRFRNLIGGARMLLAGGLGPMAVFALALLLAQQAEHLIHLGLRQLIGAQDLDTWLAFVPHTSALSRAAGLTLMVCLVGAAIDHVLGRIGVEPAIGEVETESESVGS